MPKNPPNTLIRTSHAITIRAGGITVGMIQSWNPGINRQITPAYELNAETSGQPVENIPGNVGGLTISVSRYDLYSSRMESVFGTVDAEMLGDHSDPFQVVEAWRYPSGQTEARIYTGCWFTNIGRNYSATDSRVVLVNGSLSYVSKLKAA